MKTLGIDLASAAPRTGAVVVAWESGVGHLIAAEQPADDDLISELAVGCDAIAIDAALGWPAAFTDALVAHREHRSWPDVPDIELRLRLTDRRLGEEHIWPLSVSTDRIGIVAFRAARLLPQLGRGLAPARDGSDGIFEVYPAAALTRWARQSRGYKRAVPDQYLSRRAILDWLTNEFKIDVSDHRDHLVATSDMLDALICAVLAREAAEGRLEPIPIADRTAALEEGWIHLPPRQQPSSG